MNAVGDDKARPAMGRSHVVIAVKIAVGGGLIIWLIYSGQLKLGRLASIPFCIELVLLPVLLLGAMMITSLRWWWLLQIQGVGERPGRVICLTWAGYFTNLLLPGGAGGDLAKSYLILRHRKQARARAFSTVVVDRFIGLYAFVFLGSVSILWLVGLQELNPTVQAMAAVTLSLLIAMTVASAMILKGGSRRLLLSVLPTSWRIAWNESFDLYRRATGQLFGCFGLSLVSSALTITSFAVAGAMLGDAIRVGATLLVGPLVVLASALPISPGGIGVAEVASSKLFAGFGSASGAEIMFVLRIYQIVLSLPGAAALLVISAYRPGQQGMPEAARESTAALSVSSISSTRVLECAETKAP